jgi:predicted acyltransferase
MAIFHAGDKPDEPDLSIAKWPLQREGLNRPGAPSMQTSPPALLNRLSSIDAYRGLVMFLMMAEILRIKDVARHFPDHDTWKLLAFHTSHVEWGGCSLHDLIQPSFSFLVGAALPFSIASRRSKGQRFGWMLLHALWRAILLVALGVFLRSTHNNQTRFTFEDTLSQIGLGYVFLFLLGFCKVRWQLLALVVILVGYWGAFYWYPLPPTDFDYSSVGVNPEWIEKNPLYTGIAAHWNKNTNLAWSLDQQFLPLFPHEDPLKPNGGGYATLSFIPTLATMILGLIAGGWLKGDASRSKKFLWLVAAGGVSLVAGYLLDKYGICPSVKRIWTPAWVLFSGGWCFLLLAIFYALVDVAGMRWLFFPLIVIGMNSIAAYCMAHLIPGFILQSFKIHLGDEIFRYRGETWEPLLRGGAVLLVYWLILYWMYRNRVFVRI